ncbi:MAG: restriction endonuclease subunit S [Rhodanobacter sp.]
MSGFAQLGDVADFINGAAFKPDDWCESGTPIIRIQNLTDRSKPFNRTNRAVPSKLRVQPGDLLVSWSATLGVFEWEGPEEAFLNQHIFRVIPDQRRVDKQYLRHALVGALVDMQRHLHGATMQHVNRGEFLGTRLFLPQLPEQRRIAEVLDRADALRAKRRATLAQLDSLTQSIFLDMFGNPATNPKGWPLSTVADLAEQVTDGEHLTPKRTLVGIKLLSARNVRDGFIDMEKVDYIDDKEYKRISRRCKPTFGDVLISCSGTIGRVASVETDEAFSLVRSVALVRLKRVVMNYKFFESYMRTPSLRALMTKRANASSQANLFQGPLKEIPVYLPPLELQQIFAHRITAVETLKATHRAALTELDALFASLQHRAFRGEL